MAQLYQPLSLCLCYLKLNPGWEMCSIPVIGQDQIPTLAPLSLSLSFLVSLNKIAVNPRTFMVSSQNFSMRSKAETFTKN